MDRLDIERQLREFFAVDRGAAAVYLFGSVAADAANANSDVDVAVLYRATPAPSLDSGPLDLEGALERQLGRRVDLVVLNTAPADLRARLA